MLTVSAELQGLDDALRRLTAVAAAPGKKILRQAVGQASKTLLAAAKARAPRREGVFRKSLGRKVKSYRRTGTVAGIVGPRSRYFDADKKRPSNLGHMLEFGNRHMPAQPWLRPAFEASRGMIEVGMTNVIENGIEDAAK